MHLSKKAAPLRVYTVGLHEHADPQDYMTLHNVNRVSTWRFKEDSYLVGVDLCFAFTNYADGGDLSAWVILSAEQTLYINTDGYPGVLLSAVSPSNDVAIETPPIYKGRGTTGVRYQDGEYIFRAANEPVSLYFSGTMGHVDNGESIICASVIIHYINAGNYHATTHP